jgi:tetratricopeptide (TPR) repeat protein
MWRIFPIETTPSRLVNDGIELFNQKKYEEAIARFTQALELDHTSAIAAIAWGRKGNCYVSLQKYEEAVECYDRCLEINPSFSNIWFIKGFILDSLGRKDEALTCFDRALLINPEYASAYKAKADTLKDLRRYADALECYHRAVELDAGLEKKVGDLILFCRNRISEAGTNRADALEKTAESHVSTDQVNTSEMTERPVVRNDSHDVAELKRYEETIKQFLSHLEKTQRSIFKQRIEDGSMELREQIGQERQIVIELAKIVRQEQDLISKLGVILEIQSNFIDRIMQEEGSQP